MRHNIIIIITLVLLASVGFVVFYTYTNINDTPLTSNENTDTTQVTNTSTTVEVATSTQADTAPSLLDKIFNRDESVKFVADVPFVSQAPLAQWEDDRFQDGCEEASIIMAMAWRNNEKKISKQEATERITALSTFQSSTYGFYRDSSAADTVMFTKAYYNLDDTQIYIDHEVTIEKIKNLLQSDKLVIVPADGIVLDNENFTPPGPPNHMLVIKGYDEKKGIIITNDPGTRNGEDYAYPYARFMQAIGDYPTGYHEHVDIREKVMIVVSR